jgi:catechol 2,3-dioxygenase-like lactoylglutathione lyase family enzyme
MVPRASPARNGFLFAESDDMARIRHIAMRSNRQEEIAAFYRSTFGLTEVLRHTSAESGKLAVYLTDGEINLAIIPGGPGIEGIDHFGFEVDDVAATSEAALAAGARRGATSVPQDGRKNEAFMTDPIDQRVDLSSRGWDHDGSATARINQLTMVANDPATLAAFYKDVFDLRDGSRGVGDDSACVLTDGFIEFTILANPTAGMVGSRTGVKRFGFEVDDVAASLIAAKAAGAQPTPEDNYVVDPQGQRVDLVPRGLEVLAR